MAPYATRRPYATQNNAISPKRALSRTRRIVYLEGKEGIVLMRSMDSDLFSLETFS